LVVITGNQIGVEQEVGYGTEYFFVVNMPKFAHLHVLGSHLLCLCLSVSLSIIVTVCHSVCMNVFMWDVFVEFCTVSMMLI